MWGVLFAQTLAKGKKKIKGLAIKRKRKEKNKVKTGFKGVSPSDADTNFPKESHVDTAETSLPKRKPNESMHKPKYTI